MAKGAANAMIMHKNKVLLFLILIVVRVGVFFSAKLIHHTRTG
jgi:hypothetical protein